LESGLCSLYVDPKDQCIYTPATNPKFGPVCTLNGQCTIKGYTEDGGFIVLFEDATLIRNILPTGTDKTQKRFLIRLYPSQTSDSRSLVQQINKFHKSIGQKWLVLRLIEGQDKSASFGIYIQQMMAQYEQLPAERRTLMQTAPSLGFFEDKFLVSRSQQLNLCTMAPLSPEEFIIITSDKQDNIGFKMSFAETLETSKGAMQRVNLEMLEYFNAPQLLAYRAGALLASISPYLREMKLLRTVPSVVDYGENSCGKSDRGVVYLACHGLEDGQPFDCTAAEVKKQLCTSSLAPIWLDDPPKEVLEAGVKTVYNGCKLRKGNEQDTSKVKRNTFITCNQFQLSQTEHTKITFVPEQPISEERRSNKRDLKRKAENLADKEGHRAVLWNLHYAKLLGELLEDSDSFAREADALVPDEVKRFPRWASNVSYLLMVIKLVLQEEEEWTCSYEDMQTYLKEGYLGLVQNLRVNGAKVSDILQPQAPLEKSDVSAPIGLLVEALKASQVNLKCSIRNKVNKQGETVIAVKCQTLKEAGMPNFGQTMLSSGFSCPSVANVRFLKQDSPTPWFRTGKQSVGLNTCANAFELSSQEEAFSSLQELIEEQDEKDGCNLQGAPCAGPVDNHAGTPCSKCKVVLPKMVPCPRAGCDVVYCSRTCRMVGEMRHRLMCKGAKTN